MIKLLILDIDGVITSGQVFIDSEGKEFKQIDFQDIDAIYEAKRNGLQIAIITGEDGEITNYFKQRFNPDYFYNGCKNKKDAILKIAEAARLDLSEISYIGDSKHDLEAIRIAGLGISPSNALDEVKDQSDYILNESGGKGAIREAVDYIVKNYNLKIVNGEEYNLFQKAYKQNTEMMREIISSYDHLESIVSLSKLIASCLKNECQVLFCGNGGSAADAQHLATELISRFYLERRPFNAEALTTNTSILTAISNDYSFDKVFARQVEAKGKKGDLLIGISTSGNSSNIVAALKKAKDLNMHTALLTGGYERTLAEKFADFVIKVPACLVPRIQEGHIFIGHFICELVESYMENNLNCNK
jgi:D-sedoheptulose 7-phosphate isomerase